MANTQGISGVAKQAAMSAILDSKALKAALYLASDEAEFITGVEFPVDGGRTV